MNICDIHSQNDELCSWERDEAGDLIPTPEISYRSQGRTAAFIWVLYAGGGQLDAQVNKSDDSELGMKIVTLSGEGGDYRVHLQGINIDLE